MNITLTTIPLIIGVGNPWRGDDGAGLAVTSLLEQHPAVAAGRLQVRETDGGGIGLLDAWAGAEVVFLVDAMYAGRPPGSVHRAELGVDPLPATLLHHSTHAFGVLEAVDLARVLGQLPARLVIYGIEGRQFDLGAALSPEVERATHTVAAMILNEAERS